MSEPQCDRGDVDVVGCQQHRVGVTQDVRCDAFCRERWAAERCSGGVFGEEQLDGVAAERRAVTGREERVLGVALAFFEPLLEHCAALSGEGPDPSFPAFARDVEMSGAAEHDVAHAKVREFRRAVRSDQDEQQGSGRGDPASGFGQAP